MDYNGPIERDSGSDNPEGLPTYDFLTEQERANPNSRFGRWRGWVEKRAAERHAGITEEERTRRRNRGWELPPTGTEAPRPAPSHTRPVLNLPISIPSPITPVVASQPLHPTSLAIYQFGSRFLPHGATPIRCMLSIAEDRYLLLGDSEGLGMLDILPDSNDRGEHMVIHALEGAKRREIWSGEGVYQLAVLESTPDQKGGVQGVVLALVGVEGENEKEVLKTVRMYNLSSLTSLARWVAMEKDAKPLELQRPRDWSPQQAATSPRKLQRPHTLSRGMKSLTIESPNPITTHTSHASFTTGTSVTASPVSRPEPHHEGSGDSSWEVVDDLPLRWGTDFVNLATPGSRLAACAPTFFEVWRSDDPTGRGTTLLAIATKTNILLYETPKGERAFRFVKEFYTPLPARSLNFVHQATPELARSTSHLEAKKSHNRNNSSSSAESPFLPRPKRLSTPGDPSYGSQLSLFVVFEKKAGLIRIGDSAVGEIELWDEPSPSLAPAQSSLRRSMQTLDAFGLGKEWKGTWLPLTILKVPNPRIEEIYSASSTIVLLSRGRQTHILPSPLPMPLSHSPPLRIIHWNTPPTQVTARLSFCSPDDAPSLQVIAVGEQGIEVVETPLFSLRPNRKGKGREAAEPVLRAQTHISEAGLLGRGGWWHKLDTSSGMPEIRRGIEATDRDVISQWKSRQQQEEGIYCWCRRGQDDYRVFWMGDETR